MVMVGVTAKSVYFNHAAKKYKAKEWHFLPLEQWSNMYNQLKYIEDAPVKTKVEENPYTKSNLYQFFIEGILAFGMLFMVAIVIWFLCGLFSGFKQ